MEKDGESPGYQNHVDVLLMWRFTDTRCAPRIWSSKFELTVVITTTNEMYGSRPGSYGDQERSVESRRVDVRL